MSYQLPVLTLTHTARNGKATSANNAHREATSTKMEYALLLILIVSNLIKDSVFLVMMDILYRAILALNHQYKHQQIHYALNGKVKYANNVQLVPSWD